jgi:hypothetical protein
MYLNANYSLPPGSFTRQVGGSTVQAVKAAGVETLAIVRKFLQSGPSATLISKGAIIQYNARIEKVKLNQLQH